MEERPRFKISEVLGRKKFGNGLRFFPKPRMTVLARVTRNLLDMGMNMDITCPAIEVNS
jgi:hypothetical protein